MKFKSVLAKLRTSNHKLAIETGRHCKPIVPVEQRLCTFCKSKCIEILEDEFHFVLFCPLYQQHRIELIPEKFRLYPTEDKFVDLLSSKNQAVQYNLSLYVHRSFKVREEFLLKSATQ